MLSVFLLCLARVWAAPTSANSAQLSSLASTSLMPSISADASISTTATTVSADPLSTDWAKTAAQPFAADFTPPESWLTGWIQTKDKGEPLNIVVSAQSSPQVLTPAGFQLWLNSLNISQQCLGQQGGALGSGAQMRAFLNEQGQPGSDTAELFTWRDNFGNPLYGTCLQTFKGGVHLRAFNQSSSGALFIAASTEMDLNHHHMIVPDGYDMGRDEIVQRAMGGGNGSWITTPVMSASYSVKAENISGLIPPGSENINHDIATDGFVTLLTITLVDSSASSFLEGACPAFLQALLVTLCAMLGLWYA